MGPNKNSYSVTFHVKGTDFEVPFEEVPFIRDEEPDIEPTDEMKEAGNQLFSVYQGMVEAGFSEAQAFQLLRDLIKNTGVSHAAKD